MYHGKYITGVTTKKYDNDYYKGAIPADDRPAYSRLQRSSVPIVVFEQR